MAPQPGRAVPPRRVAAPPAGAQSPVEAAAGRGSVARQGPWVPPHLGHLAARSPTEPPPSSPPHGAQRRAAATQVEEAVAVHRGPHRQPQVQLRHRQVEASATKQREQVDEEKISGDRGAGPQNIYFGTVRSTGTPERPARSDPPRPAAGCVDQTLCAGQRSVERRPLSAAAAAPTPPFSRPAASGTGFWRRDPAIIGHKSPKKSNSVILARQRLRAT